MKTLTEVMSNLKYLDTVHTISTYLTRAIESDLGEEDIPTARRFLADLFERNDYPELAFDQYEFLEDEENMARLGIKKAENILRYGDRYCDTQNAVRLFLRFGGREVAIKALCSQVTHTHYLEDILILVGGDEDANIATILGFNKTPRNLLAQCEEKQGNYSAAAEKLVQADVCNSYYDWRIKLHTLAEDHEKAADVCLQAQEDDSHYKEDKNYPRGAFRLFMEAGKPHKALETFSRYWIKAPKWKKLEQDVYAAYVAQSYDEQDAWKQTVRKLEEPSNRWIDELHDPLSIAYEKVGRLEDAGREVLKKRYYYDERRAYDLFVRSGMSEKAAAAVVLERIKNEFPTRAHYAFYYEKAGHVEEAAAIYGFAGNVDSVIRCKKKLQS